MKKNNDELLALRYFPGTHQSNDFNTAHHTGALLPKGPAAPPAATLRGGLLYQLTFFRNLKDHPMNNIQARSEQGITTSGTGRERGKVMETDFSEMTVR